MAALFRSTRETTKIMRRFVKEKVDIFIDSISRHMNTNEEALSYYIITKSDEMLIHRVSYS